MLYCRFHMLQNWIYYSFRPTDFSIQKSSQTFMSLSTNHDEVLNMMPLSDADPTLIDSSEQENNLCKIYKILKLPLACFCFMGRIINLFPKHLISAFPQWGDVMFSSTPPIVDETETMTIEEMYIRVE